MSLLRAAAACAAILAALAGCKQSVPPVQGLNPNYKEPMINAQLSRYVYYDNTVEYNRFVEVFDNDGLRMIPVVKLNGTDVPVYNSNYTTYYEYGDQMWFPTYASYELSVEHYWGSAFSRVIVPGEFRLTNPPDLYTLGRESTLVITWRPAPGAQWYWTSILADYDYSDSLGEWDSYTFSLDTTVFDTFLILPPNRIFPGFVREVEAGDALADVAAGYGPALEPGDVGNVKGAGFGFFNAFNQPIGKYFYIVAPPALRRCPGGAWAREKLAALLRARGNRGR